MEQGVKFAISVDIDKDIIRSEEKLKKFFSEIEKDGTSITDIVQKSLKEMSKAASDEFKDIGERFSFMKEVLEDMSRELNSMRDTLKNSSSSVDYGDIVAELDNLIEVVDGVNNGLNEQKQEFDGLTQKQLSYKAELNVLEKQLQALELAGKQNTKEFQELSQKAAKLRDAISDVKKMTSILAHDQAGFQGIINGLQGVSGAMSAAMGTLGMFTDESEKMQKVMLRVQSLMSITIGLQQVQATLDKDSAFRLVTLNGLKEWWVKVTTQAAVAQTTENATVVASGVAATGAAGAFKLLGASIKSIPGIGWLVAAVSAIGAIVGLVVKRLNKEKELTGEMQRQKKLLEGIEEAKMSALKSTEKEVAELQSAVDRLGNLKKGSHEYKTTLEQIADTIGLQRGYIEDNIDSVKRLADQWIKVKYAQKLGDEYLTRATNIKVDTEDVISKIGMMSKKDNDKAEELLKNLGFVSEEWIERYIDSWKKTLKNNSAKALKEYQDMQEWLRRQAEYESNKFIKKFEEQQKELQRANLSLETAKLGSKEYWQSIVNEKTAQWESIKGRISFMSGEEKNNAEKQLKSLKKEIEAAQKNLDSVTYKTTQKNSEKELTEEEKKQKKLINAKIAGDKAIRQAEIDSRENMIEILEMEQEAIKDGNNKVIRQIEIEYAKREVALDKIENEFIEQNRDAKQREYEENNPMAKLPFDRTSITELTDAQREYIAERRKLSEQIKNTSIDNLLKDEAINFETYLQKRARVLKEYADREKVFHDENGNVKSGYEGNVEELKRQRDEAVASIDMEFAQRGATFQNWMNGISTLTINQLKKLLEQAKKTLKHLEESGNATPEQLARARAELAAIDNEVRNAQLSPEIEDIRKWDRLKNALGEAGEAFKSLGKEIGGIIGDVIDMLGTVMTTTSTIIDSIQSAANNSIDAIESTSKAAAKAIQAAQNAVVILAIIQAIYTIIVQIRDFIDNNFDTDNNKVARFFSDFLHYLTDTETMLENLAWALLGPIGTAIGVLTSNNTASKRKQHQNDIAAIIDEYDNLGKTLDKLKTKMDGLYGESNVENKKQQIEILQQRYNQLANAIELEQNTKNPNQDNIDQWTEAMADIEDEIENLHDSLYDAIFGEDINSAIENFANAVTNAWSNGIDSSRAANEYIRDMIKKTALQAILNYTQASARIDDIRRKIQDALANDGIISDSEQSEIESMAQQLMDDVKEQFDWAERLFKDESSASATSKGIAQASQESIDELNGRFTVIQSHTAQLLENSSVNMQNVLSILFIISNISEDTAAIRSMVSGMSDNVQYIRNNM